MLNRRLLPLVLVCAAALVLPACGGNTSSAPAANQSIAITSTVLPAATSGEEVNHVIPVEGGCKGPYILEVVQGQLPEGIYLDNDNVAIRGTILEAGSFEFTIQATATGCTPFSSTSAKFSWDIPMGEIRLVEVRIAGVNRLIPAGQQCLSGPNCNPPTCNAYPALPDTVYGSPVAMTLVWAGGDPQFGYTTDLVETPGIPGATLPSGSFLNGADIGGEPVQAKDDIECDTETPVPFIFTVEGRDAFGRRGQATIQWRITTPKVRLLTEDLQDGVAGQSYNSSILVADGVPPFGYILMDSSFTNKIDASIYPAPADFGPDYRNSHDGAPSEGIYMDEDAGVLTGIPRRRGDFRVHVRVRSKVLPALPTQTVTATYEFNIGQATTPLEHNPAYLEAGGSFSPTPPYPGIPEGYAGEPFEHTILAVGAVAKDGKTDAPHASQVMDIVGNGPGQEVPGQHEWAFDDDPDGNGGVDLTAFMTFSTSGQFAGTPPFGFAPQEIGLTATDVSLPISPSVQQTATEKVMWGAGPDKIFLLESSQKHSYASATTSNDYVYNHSEDVHDWDMMVLEDRTPRVYRAPLEAELSGEGATQHIVPKTVTGTVTLASLLSNMDLLRVSINPSTRHDNLHALSPEGPRQGQHAMRNTGYGYYGGPAYSSSYYNYQTSPTATCIRVQPATGATPNAAEGIYVDGGQLYCFDTTSRFGLFMVRGDGSIYVPAAFTKSTYYSFGDGWMQSYAQNLNSQTSNTANKSTLFRMPQMTISPDGRVGALILRQTTNMVAVSMSDVKILLISLTGERMWPDNDGDGVDDTYKIVGTGYLSGTTTGDYLPASSLTLTNQYLYYQSFDYINTYVDHWSNHWLWRYEIEGGAASGALLHSNADPDWTNVASTTQTNRLQTPGNDRLYISNINSFTSTSYSYRMGFLYWMNGYNGHESSQAPQPFRVNTEGNACAILAAKSDGYDGTGTVTDSLIQSYHVWVDYEGDLYKLSAEAGRGHYRGGVRGYSLNLGPADHKQWGAYQGPGTGFEISDDGLQVAVVVNRRGVFSNYRSTSSYYYSQAYHSMHNWGWDREDIIHFAAQNGASWGSGVTTTEITEDIFGGGANWRFGALVFTREGDGLVFWGGHTSWYTGSASDSSYKYEAVGTLSTAYYYDWVGHGNAWMRGSLYAYNFGTDKVRNLLSSGNGGPSALTAGNEYTSISPASSRLTENQGKILPIGGFIAKGGDFFYMVTYSGYGTGTLDSTCNRMVGVNIRSMDTTQSINGNQDGMGFSVEPWPAQYGFLMAASTPYYTGIGYSSYSPTTTAYGYYIPGGDWGFGRQVAATATGRVFFSSQYQNYSTTASTYYLYGGLKTRSYGYGYLSASQIFMFDAQIGGPLNQLTSFSNTSPKGVDYVEVNDLGTAVAFIYNDYTYPQYNFNSYENLGYVGGIQTDASGDVTDSYYHTLTPGQGRVSEVMTHGIVPGQLWYAYDQGFAPSSDEGTKRLYKTAADSTNANVEEIPTSVVPERWLNPIWVGR